MSSSKQVIQVKGVIEEALPGIKFRVRLENDLTIVAQISGKMRKGRIRLVRGDEVSVELSPYDLTKGRIVYRKN
ncbi:MAG: translation initiation factor IF-1 [Candidatus Nomurabacteria bacterium]|nr:MAG: translation initiation factor IF-1 [Candidatus Nomurabacteria bacterium]HRV76380.1 translation initiation factor IF-1 [Candidatus Saccharimonadales bacterium]